ncbi:MAG: acyl carrier protein [Desulfobacteraceae bacterium]|nr:MAG: acyl carrier protein [Desulfobacteraceae bacterium]
MNEVLSILTVIRPECDFTRSDDFIKEGLLDSLDIVTLVSELEDRLGISIDGQDISPENFKNLDTLLSLLGRYRSL